MHQEWLSTKQQRMNWKLETRHPASVYVVLRFDWKTFQCKGNTAVLVGKMYHFILSDLIKSLLTLGLVRVEDLLLVLAELCQTVFREASVDIYPTLWIVILSTWSTHTRDNYQSVHHKIVSYVWQCSLHTPSSDPGCGTTQPQKSVLHISSLFTDSNELYKTFFTPECWWIPQVHVTAIIRHKTSAANIAHQLQSNPAARYHLAVCLQHP